MKWEDVSLRSANDEEVSLSILRHFLQFLCASNFIWNQQEKGDDLHNSTVRVPSFALADATD
jgi:hypothetical protein